MADTAGSGGAPNAPIAPPSLGQKLGFSIPAIVVALVLSIGISYAILSIINGNTRQELVAKMNDQETRLTTTIGELKKKNDDLQTELTAEQKKTKVLEEENSKKTEAINKMDLDYKGFRIDYSKFVDVQKSVDTTQNRDIATATDAVREVERKVKYIDERLAKVEESAKDIPQLKSDTAGLQKEYTVLKSDLVAVRNKADVTEKDLTDLAERARLFQLRVLAARAREAAEIARKNDLKSLLTRLEDIQDEEPKR